MHNRPIFNAVCIHIVICKAVRLIVGKVTLRDMQFYRIRRMVINYSTTKNTRLLDRQFISKTEHLDLQFLVQQICDSLH